MLWVDTVQRFADALLSKTTGVQERLPFRNADHSGLPGLLSPFFRLSVELNDVSGVFRLSVEFFNLSVDSLFF